MKFPFPKTSLVVSMAILGCAAANARAEEPYLGSRFADVWAQVSSDPYAALPHETVTVGSFFLWGQNKLAQASIRTVSDESDLLPRFEKLVHPNGICLKGSWNITEDSEYTGYFQKGSKAALIARASVALSDTERGKFRGFGFAGKLFPTADENDGRALRTANFFAIDNLGGTMADHYMDAEMTNEPAVTLHPSEAFYLAPLAATARLAFSKADIKPGRRQVYNIAELGLADGAFARTPRWMMIRGAQGARFDDIDFRDELMTALKAGPVDLDVLVTEDRAAGWSKLGYVELTDAVASDSCDHRLHFSHPKFRTDLP